MFEDICPYNDLQVKQAMCRIVAHEKFASLAAFVFPECTLQEVKEKMLDIDTIEAFQKRVMYRANERIIQESVEELTYGGQENMDADKNYVFVSNHRDIMLDASFLQNILYDLHRSSTQITFGANLMQGQLVIDIGKSNKMFRVERPGNNRREFYQASKHLSDYIRHTLIQQKESLWIAQGNGRTKNGIDRTDQGLINMFCLSGDKDKAKSLAQLNILPVSVSYEWEPCDFLKTLELYARRRGPYLKKEGEDLNSILTGIRQKKGRVHFQICAPLTENEMRLYENLSSNDFNRQVAQIINQRICTAYRLWPNNFIAHDLLWGDNRYENRYRQAQKNRFVERMQTLENYAGSYDVEELKTLFLGIYANPVDSTDAFKKL